MAIRFAVANGNWSNPAIWNGGTLPAIDDDVFANNFTVTINGTFTVLTIRTTANTTPSIIAGGGFTFANGGDLTCTALNAIEVGSTTPVLLFNLPVGQNATFRGNVTSIINVSNYNSIRVANSGTLNLIGNYTISNGTTANRAIISVTSNSVLNIVGNIASNQTSTQVSNQTGNTLWITGSGAIVNITGNISGSNTNSFLAAYQTIYATVGCTINITGNITTNSAPSIWLNAGGTLNVIGNITGGNDYPAIYNINAPATIDLLGVTTSGSGYPAVQGLATTFVKVRGNVVNTDTYCAIYAGRVTIDNNVTSWQFKDSTNTVTRTLYTAGVALGNPATNNVRSGVTYGASNELTGTLIVPNPSNVLLGVPTDNTTGTYSTTPALIATEIFTKLLSSTDFNTSGSFGKLVKDNLDAQVSSRLASSSYVAPDNADISAIKARTDLIPNNPASVDAVGAIVASYNV